MPRTLKAQVPDAKAALLNALSEGATVLEACRKAKCDAASFYRWQNEDSEFSEGVTRAREAFAVSIDDDLKAATNTRLLDLLRHGVKRARKSKKVISYDNGDPGRTETETVTETLETPKWVFDKLLPDSLVEKAVAAGAELHLHRHESAEG